MEGFLFTDHIKKFTDAFLSNLIKGSKFEEKTWPKTTGNCGSKYYLGSIWMSNSRQVEIFILNATSKTGFCDEVCVSGRVPYPRHT